MKPTPLTDGQKAILVSFARTRWGLSASLTLHVLFFPHEPICPACEGTGHDVDDRRCQTCDGLGYVTADSTDRPVR